MMVSRDDLYQCFGPKLTEAIVTAVLAEINECRAKGNLPPRTMEQFTNTIKNGNDTIPDYKWMHKEIST